MSGVRWIQAVRGTVMLSALALCVLLVLARDARATYAPVATALAGLICLLEARLLTGTPRARVERSVWRAFAGAATCVGIGLLAETVLEMSVQLGFVDPLWSGTGFAVAGIGFYSYLFQGLIRSNQFRMDVSDAGDWLAGACAVLVFVAVGGMLISLTSAPTAAWPELQSSIWLAHLGGLEVLTGTAATVAVLGGLVKDLRALIVTGALLTAFVVQTAVGLAGDPRSASVTAQVTWVLIVTLLVGCSRIRPVRLSARVVVPHSPVSGALVVLACSMAVLAFDGLVGPGRPATTVVASAAALGSGARLVQLLRSLAGLAQSQREARTDDLTGIANRRGLSAALKVAAESDQDTALLVLDLDRFKEVNDQHGHGVGDEVLQGLALRLLASLPGWSLLGRLGGDEFAVLLPGATAAEAATVGRVAAEVCAEPVETSVGRMKVGASVGVATTEFDGRGNGELMRRADSAMYVAKRAGGGVSIYDGDADRRAQLERQRLKELRAVLAPDASDRDRAQLVVHYQPQLDVCSGAVVGAEALVRWQHPEFGLLSPDTFLDLVERNRLMPELTSRVLHQAAAEAVRWNDAGHRMRVSVNLSASSLDGPDLGRLVDEVTADTGIDLACLVLELTETTLMSDPDLALQVTRAIAARGIGISIDDYGTGYSSLAYLNDLPAVELKLDRSFTTRLTSEPRTAAIVAGTIELAHGLGLRLIAEGVEDEATLAALKGLGCDESQGYLHARPMPADDFLAWMDNRSLDRRGMLKVV